MNKKKTNTLIKILSGEQQIEPTVNVQLRVPSRALLKKTSD